MDYTDTETIGIVLRRFDYGESSQIGHLLTPVNGRISVLAKGIKKPNAYLKGPFDLFQMAKITFRMRRGSDLGILQKYEPMTGFSKMRSRLSTLLAGFYLTELLYEGVREDDGNPGAFEIYARSLGSLDQESNPASRAIVLAAEASLLEAFGFAVNVETCVQCGEPRSGEQATIFPLAGGYVCGSCPRPSVQPLRLEAKDCRLLISLGRAGPKHAAKIRMSVRQHATLRTLMRLAFQGVFDKSLKSEPFVLNPRTGFLPQYASTPHASPAEVWV